MHSPRRRRERRGVAENFKSYLTLARHKREAYYVRMLDWSDCSEVERANEKLSGAWVFRGTRVPVRALFENLESGATIEQFLEWFPGVRHEQIAAVLEHAEASLTEA